MSMEKGRAWSAERFFSALPVLSPLRVISQCGPSTFEAICAFGTHGFANGFLNAITPTYHWHVRVEGIGEISSHDETHARSGRRVLFFALRERSGESPFLHLYVHRERGAEFEPERQQAFARLHAEFSAGVRLEGSR
jgi:hypothetical protein